MIHAWFISQKEYNKKTEYITIYRNLQENLLKYLVSIT